MYIPKKNIKNLWTAFYTCYKLCYRVKLYNNTDIKREKSPPVCLVCAWGATEPIIQGHHSILQIAFVISRRYSAARARACVCVAVSSVRQVGAICEPTGKDKRYFSDKILTL